MTVQPTRDQLLDMTEDLGVLGDRPELCDEVVDGLWAALDQAEEQVAEEKRLRMKATAAATKAEERIEAVQDVLDGWQVGGYDALLRRIRRALDGDA